MAEEEAHDGRWADCNGFHELNNSYRLPSELYNRLFPHQRQGVAWMWGLNQKRMGGILGDDMGMGKTIQIVAFLCGLFISGKARHVLIGMPLGLLENWGAEFRAWFPNMRVKVYHGPAATIRKDLAVVMQKGGVLLTTYDKIRVCASELSGGGEHVWDYVILDEGHYIKNASSKKTKAVHMLRAHHKLLLSGTPIQNNMEELWTLFDWVCDGSLLSTKRNFMTNFGKVIKKGEARDATADEKKVGNKIAQALRELISPYLLRREKSLLRTSPANESDVGLKASASGAATALGSKHELAVWIALSEAQIALYENFLDNPDIQDIPTTTRSPLNALGVLRKICDHPALISSTQKDCESLDLSTIARPDGNCRDLMAQSAKLSVAIELLQTLQRGGHRTLVVASSRIMLDIIEKCIVSRDIAFTRIDGTIIDRRERQRRINMFNGDLTCTCFLLTSQVAIGITLTGADRVIVYDPSWNPKRDAQAVDRAYRVGQQRDVVVYRLLTCGTMEEKVYRNQIRKDYLAKTAMENGNHTRYFTQSELKDMFILGDTQRSETQQFLSRRHPLGQQPQLSEFAQELDAIAQVKGVSRHDQLYLAAEDFSDEDDEEGYAVRQVTESLQQFQLGEFSHGAGGRVKAITPERHQRRMRVSNGAKHTDIAAAAEDASPNTPSLRHYSSAISVSSTLEEPRESKRDSDPETDDESLIDSAAPTPARRNNRVIVIESSDEENSLNDSAAPTPARRNNRVIVIESSDEDDSLLHHASPAHQTSEPEPESDASPAPTRTRPGHRARRAVIDDSESGEDLVASPPAVSLENRTSDAEDDTPNSLTQHSVHLSDTEVYVNEEAWEPTDNAQASSNAGRTDDAKGQYDADLSVESDAEDISDISGVQSQTSCPEGQHRSRVYNVRRCRCTRTDDQMDRYDELLFAYRKDMTKRDRAGALKSLQKAFGICDDDARVAVQLIRLSTV
ncbi:DNA excision repair protein ERCC-6-like [Geranomyces variabilis]|nr:DNA excision repair protein ERCC-6-like [Geranomyces variabilis]